MAPTGNTHLDGANTVALILSTTAVCCCNKVQVENVCGSGGLPKEQGSFGLQFPKQVHLEVNLLRERLVNKE